MRLAGKIGVAIIALLPIVLIIIYLYSKGIFNFKQNLRPLTAAEIGRDPNKYSTLDEEYQACILSGGNGNRYYWDVTNCDSGAIKLPKLAVNGVNSICCNL